MVAKVVNLVTDEFDVYIGRAGHGHKCKWGNPFIIGQHGSREEVIAQYKQLLWAQIKTGKVTIDDLIALDGKRLGCFCKPLPCHGDVIAGAVEWAIKQRGGKNEGS